MTAPEPETHPPSPPDPPASPGFLKKILKGVAIFFILLVVGITIAVNVIDPASLREPITRALSEASGLDVQIGGLGLDWSQGLGLRADEVSVFSRQGNRSLFSSEAMFLSVRWGPLLDRKVEVEEAVIRKPVFLIHPNPEAPPPVDGAPPARSPEPLTPAQVRLDPMKRLLMGLHLNAETVRVEDAVVLWFREDEVKGDPLEVKASMVLRIDRPDQNRLDLAIHDLQVSTGEMKVTGEAQGQNVLSSAGTLEIRLDGNPFDLQALSAFLPYLPAQAKKFWTRLGPAGQITSWNLKTRAAGVNLFEESILEGKGVESDLQFEARNLVVPPPPSQPDLRLGFGALKGNLRWVQGKVEHDLQGDLQGIPLQVKGNLTLPQSAGKEPAHLQTVVRVTRASVQVFDPWVPPDWKMERGEVSHRIQVRGRLDRLKSLKIDGVVEGRDLLAGFRRDRHFKVPLKSVKGEWKLEGDRVVVPVLHVAPPHGTVRSNASFNIADRSYELEFDGKGLRIEDFYLQNVDGNLALKGKLGGVLPARGDPLAQVSGKVAVRATAGRFYELEPLRALLTVLNPLSVTKLNEKGLGYDSLGGDFVLQKGPWTTDNFALLSPEMKIYMTGSANPVTDRINMKGRFQPSRELDQVVKSVPILGEILTGGKQGGVIETRFSLTGPLRRPKISLDAGGTLTGKGSDILRELGKLPGKLGR